MAKIFLDTNYFIDSIHRKPEKEILLSLKGHIPYTSALSFHIYCYVYKIKIPNRRVMVQREKFQIVEFSESVLDKALEGPMDDFEDNVQLHSSVEANCDFFLTEDKKLLDLKFFGKLRLIKDISAL